MEEAGGKRRTGSPRSRRRLAELRASEALYRAASALTGRLIWAADAGGAVTIMRAPFAAVTGVDDSRALGEGWLKVVHPDDRAAVRRRWRQAVRSGELYAARVPGAPRRRRLPADAVPRGPDARRGRPDRGWAGTTEDIEESRKRR